MPTGKLTSFGLKAVDSDKWDGNIREAIAVAGKDGQKLVLLYNAVVAKAAVDDHYERFRKAFVFYEGLYGLFLFHIIQKPHFLGGSLLFFLLCGRRIFRIGQHGNDLVAIHIKIRPQFLEIGILVFQLCHII